MVLAESMARLAATLLAILQNRVELAATEVEEASLHYFSSLMLSLAAMFCLGMAIGLGVLLVLVLYWESHRVVILSVLMTLFAFAGGMMLLLVRAQLQHKPKLLAHTMTELSRDRELLQPPT